MRLGRRSLLVAAAALAGCGFELRRPPQMAFTSIALVGFAPRSTLADELKKNLGKSVRLIDKPAEAEVVLHVTADERSKSIVATTAAAQVREYTLRLRFAFRADTPGGRELIAPAELLLSRDLSYIETAQLAKEQEEAELYREMQSDVVNQVMRRLASIRLT